MAEYADRKNALDALLGLPIKTYSILEKRQSSPDDSSSVPTTNPPGATVDNYTSPTSTNSDDDGGHNGLSHYYFVFFAIALCAGIIGAFFLYWRRRRILLNHNQRYNNAYLGRGRGAPIFPPMRRQNQPGSWFGGEQHVEEGLNEEGQAPPPYRPKEPENATIVGGPNRGVASGEAVPLQPLPPVASVDPGGHRPPDYEEHFPVDGTTSGSRETR